MTGSKRISVVAIAALASWACPANAGEINGNGTQLPAIQSESLCAYSGLNDAEDESALERRFGDPGGFVQSFGYAFGWGGIQDPESFDPRTGEGTAMPGFYCNPTRSGITDPED